MEHTKQKFVGALQRLLGILHDGKEGYLKAAENSHDPEHKALFNQYSQQRAVFADELKMHISSLGGDAHNDKGGPLGTFHRIWMDIKTTLTNTKHDDRAILEACKTGEQTALEAYDDVLQGSILETDLKPVIVNQRTEISRAFQEVSRLHIAQYPPKSNEFGE